MVQLKKRDILIFIICLSILFRVILSVVVDKRSEEDEEFNLAELRYIYPSNQLLNNNDSFVLIIRSQKPSINEVTFEQLVLIPGIGENIATRILEYRMKHGKINSGKELLSIKGIGEKKLKILRDYLKIE